MVGIGPFDIGDDSDEQRFEAGSNALEDDEV